MSESKPTPIRRPLSKGMRFDIFKRDAFTCQYCGAQPPEVVLEVDHIRSVKSGGANDPLNLITSCYDCNRGKAAKELGLVAPRPDADLAFYEAQQEIAEMRRYQLATEAKEVAIVSVIETLQAQWERVSGLDWVPSESTLRPMLRKYGVELLGDALLNVGGKVSTGYVSPHGTGWVRYLWTVLRNMEAERG